MARPACCGVAEKQRLSQASIPSTWDIHTGTPRPRTPVIMTVRRVNDVLPLNASDSDNAGGPKLIASASSDCTVKLFRMHDDDHEAEKTGMGRRVSHVSQVSITQSSLPPAQRYNTIRIMSRRSLLRQLDTGSSPRVPTEQSKLLTSPLGLSCPKSRVRCETHTWSIWSMG